MEIIKYSAFALAIGFGLYSLWKLVEALETRKRQRDEKARWASGNVSICRYGVNADGEITRFRSRMTEEEIAARSARGSASLDIPDFLRKQPPDENPAAKK